MQRVGEQFKNSFSSFHNNYTAIGKKIVKPFEIGSGLKSFLELQQKWPLLHPSSIFGEICWHDKYFTRLSWDLPTPPSLEKIFGSNKRNQIAARELAKRGWFLSLSMSIGTIRQILKLMWDADVSGAEALVESHLEESLDEIRDGLIDRFGRFKTKIEQAFQLHTQESFYGSVELFLTLSDGIRADIFNVSPLSRKGKTLRELDTWLAKHSEDKHIFAWYWSIIREPLPINVSKPDIDNFVDPLNRHEVLHCFSSDHGTHRNSLKALSWLTYIEMFALLQRTDYNAIPYAALEPIGA